MPLKIAKHGEQMGCVDQSKPEKYTPEQLSRVHDLLISAQSVNEIINEALAAFVFRQLPESMKLEYNYSNWKYVEKR